MGILKGKYVVLGGSGLIGTSVLSLLKDVDGVEVVSTYFSRKPRVYANNIHHIYADLRNREACYSIMKDVDYVVLLASNILLYSMPEEIIVNGMTSNLIINSQVLEAAHRGNVKKIVWMSSTTAYPAQDGLLYEDDLFKRDPPCKYFAIGWMTRFIEKLCIIYSQMMESKIEIAIVRPSCIYGENEGFDFDKCHLLPSMVRRIVEKHDVIEVWGDGTQKRDLIHADDAALACLVALERVDGFDTFNIGDGKSYSINDIINIICEVMGTSVPKIKYIDVSYKIEKERKFSFDKMRDILKFNSSISLRDGITRLVKECRRKYG